MRGVPRRAFRSAISQARGKKSLKSGEARKIAEEIDKLTHHAAEKRLPHLLNVLSKMSMGKRVETIVNLEGLSRRILEVSKKVSPDSPNAVIARTHASVELAKTELRMGRIARELGYDINRLKLMLVESSFDVARMEKMLGLGPMQFQ